MIWKKTARNYSDNLFNWMFNEIHLYLLKVKTAHALGWNNILRVLIYRVRKKTGLFKRSHRGVRDLYCPFFKYNDCSKMAYHDNPNWVNEAKYFGHLSISVSKNPPDWFQNPLNKKFFLAEMPWWKISDFEQGYGDIKLIWEASRMNWAPLFAVKAKMGQADFIVRLNTWIADWCEKNKPYFGPNWKCGQEAAIRVINLAITALLLETTHAPQPSLIQFIEMHLDRISQTLTYALAQNNNHGISEAAALYMGGSWLAVLGRKQGKIWHKRGRRWLENRAKRLILSDGSFSQYSVNYHRLILDTYSVTELWRTRFQLPEFSPHLVQKIKNASCWLATVTDKNHGDAPNLGANDGAYLLQIGDVDFRDYRPSVQLAMVLFSGSMAYHGEGIWNTYLNHFNLRLPDKIILKEKSHLFDQGGFAVLKKENATVLFRYPRFKFRPAQSDIFHIDLWHDGENLLRDAGTYSYQTENESSNYFSSSVAHNTIQFDDLEPMPRLSRFLFGGWLKTKKITHLIENSATVEFSAEYQTNHGARHERTIFLNNNFLIVSDKVAGKFRKAILRWRLQPGVWTIQGLKLNCNKQQLSVFSTTEVKRVEIMPGWESRYYLNKGNIPILEVEVHNTCQLYTIFKWAR